jgi:hypothetical protein
LEIRYSTLSIPPRHHHLGITASTEKLHRGHSASSDTNQEHNPGTVFADIFGAHQWLRFYIALLAAMGHLYVHAYGYRMWKN